MKCVRKINKYRALAAIFILLLSCWRPGLLAQIADDALEVTASFKAGEAVTPETAIEITLSRVLSRGEKAAITIGQTDVTGLFTHVDRQLVYNATHMPLPVGESKLTVYLIAANGDWKEAARLPLLVESASKSADEVLLKEVAADNKTKPEEQKTEKEKSEPESDKSKSDLAEEKPAETEKKRVFKFLPTFTISIESQPVQSNFPASARPETRATFTDFNITGSLKTEGKIGKLETESSFDFAGSSFKEKTLQFGTLAREAPDVDLASYLANFKIGKAKVAFGHTSFGNNRHLVNSFSSRGVSVNIPLNKRFDLTAGIMNGTSVLGFSNFTGVSKIRHQMQGATLGVELFPKRQNAMRVEFTGFNGYLQALNSVSEGRVVDAERSRGLGVRFLTSDRSERFKLEAGYSLSRFFNPRDTTLDPDGNAVPLPAALRFAHYVDASYQVLKDLKITKTRNLNLSVAYRHEFVEPLYKSLGASPSADKFSQEFGIDGSLGEISFQAGHTRSNDNLRNVPSILKLLTRSYRASIALPVTALFKKTEKASPFLPRLGYSVDITHGSGAGIPVNGGFESDLSTIPDLMNTNQTFTSGWKFGKFSVDYTYNRSYADNRQTGNENKDQLGWVHGITVGIAPLETLTFNTGFNLDSQRNFELSQINRTTALTFGVNWAPFKGATFTTDLSHNIAGDAARTKSDRNINYSAQFAYSFSFGNSGFKKFGMQSFVRFADAYARNRDFVNVLIDRKRTRIATAGMTFNFF